MDQTFSLSTVLWRKIKETFRIDFILEKKPKTIMVLYEIDIDDLNIDLEAATKWYLGFFSKNVLLKTFSILFKFIQVSGKCHSLQRNSSEWLHRPYLLKTSVEQYLQ